MGFGLIQVEEHRIGSIDYIALASANKLKVEHLHDSIPRMEELYIR